MKRQANGYSIRTDRKLNKKLTSIKEQTGASSIKDLLKVILKCPQLPNYLFDFYRETAFDLTPQQKEAYEKENKIKPIGLVEAKLIKPKSNKILYIPKDVEVVHT